MAGEKEIRTQIKSIKNTQKITRAMEMVAASKMRRAQDRMQASRPYSAKIASVIGHLALGQAEYRHPYLVEREAVRRVGYVIISTDRGLCGGLNINLFREVVSAFREWQGKGVDIDVCLLGNKAVSFFKRLRLNVLAQATHLGDSPEIADLIGTLKVMLDSYEEGQLDRVYVATNQFVNTMSQKARITQLLPVVPSDDEKLRHRWDYIYEPDSKEVLDGLLLRYLESLAYQGVVENIACEMAARMVAMKSATDNATSLISELQLAYNKARQAAITQEISEIVGGAAAV